MGELNKKKHYEQLESLKEDPEVKYLADDIKTRAEAVKNIRKKEGFSIAFLKEVTTFVSYMNVKAASEILACKQDMSTSNKSFKLVVSEYLKNSDQLLEFCSALDKFVKSARDSHSYTQYAVEQYFENKMENEFCLKILEKLKKLKSTEDIHAHSAESLYQKIKGLITQFETLSQNLKQEMDKIDEEKKLVGSQKKRTSLVYKSITTIGLFCATLAGADFLPDLADIVSGFADVASNVADGASGVGDAALSVGDAASGASNTPTHPHIESARETIVECANNHETASKYAVKAGFMAVASAPIAVGHSLLMSNFDNKQNYLDNQKKAMDATCRKSQVSVTELGNIQIRIDHVVNEIDSLLAKTNTAIKMSDIDYLMKDMKQKLEQFMKKIDDLDAEAVKCTTETLKARDEVCSLIKR